MSKFDEREKGFEKKFIRDEELQFKVNAKRNKYLGEWAAEIMADYIPGPSHVMPTGGTARFSSALSARDFIRVTPVLTFDETTAISIWRFAINGLAILVPNKYIPS